MKHGIFRLCVLMSVFCCSCVSRMHRAAYEYPRRYEAAWLQNNSVAIAGNGADMKLTKRLLVYECNGQWYLPVNRIHYRKRVIQGSRWMMPYETADISYEDKKQYYLPISAELAGLLCTAARAGMTSQELAPRIQAAELLNALPPQAKPHPILCPVSGGDEPGILLAQTGTHVSPAAIWAYPAAALLFVADIPVTVVSSTVGGIGFALYALLYPAELFR